MNILRICQETPYPPSDGVRLEPYRITKSLAERGHNLTLVCFQTDARDVEPMRQWCDLYIVPFAGRNTALNLVKGVAEGFPVNYVKYRDRELLARVERLLSAESFDATIVDYSALGWFAFRIRKLNPSIPIVTRWHNLDTLIWQRWTDSQKNALKRRLGRIQTGFVRRFETELALNSDLCLMVGANDDELLRHMAPAANVRFLPAGIDTDHYSFQPAAEGQNLLFMASTYKWHANLDSVRWLHDEIMPLVWKSHPDTVLYITGADHTPEMQTWTADARVVLTGWVPDEREIASKSSALVVPMRLGGGIKLKILTAFAMGKAVVTTSRGAEGMFDLVDGSHALVRDSTNSFADAVNEVLDNSLLRQRLAENGRELVCARYDWNGICDEFEALLESVVTRRENTRPALVVNQAS